MILKNFGIKIKSKSRLGTFENTGRLKYITFGNNHLIKSSVLLMQLLYILQFYLYSIV